LVQVNRGNLRCWCEMRRRADNGPRGKRLRPLSKKISEMGWVGKWWAYGYWARMGGICER
jgi:hypothetical protein